MSDPNKSCWQSRSRTLVVLALAPALLLILSHMVPSIVSRHWFPLVAGLPALWLVLAPIVLKPHRKPSADETILSVTLAGGVSFGFLAPMWPVPCLSLAAVSIIVWGTPHWFRPAPGKFIVGLLAVEGVLLLSQCGGCFPFNKAKGQAAVIAVECLGAWLLFLLSWFITSRIYGWRFQFSLRSLFALVILVAVPFSWLAIERDKARRQSTAVDAIKAHGGTVQYDFSLGKIPPVEPELGWPLSLLGVDYSYDVLGVEYSNSTSGADAVAALKDLKTLRQLTLHGGQFTDRNLADLPELPCLTQLDLDTTAVTDKGLEHLEDFPKLAELAIRSSPISGEGLVHVSRLNGLAALDLSGTNVTDAELEHLHGLTDLRRLSLVGTRVTTAGVAQLRRTLTDCAITGEPPSIAWDPPSTLDDGPQTFTKHTGIAWPDVDEYQVDTPCDGVFHVMFAVPPALVRKWLDSPTPWNTQGWLAGPIPAEIGCNCGFEYERPSVWSRWSGLKEYLGGAPEALAIHKSKTVRYAARDRGPKDNSWSNGDLLILDPETGMVQYWRWDR